MFCNMYLKTKDKKFVDYSEATVELLKIIIKLFDIFFTNGFKSGNPSCALG